MRRGPAMTVATSRSVDRLPLLRSIVSAETGLVGFLVNELADTFLATFAVVEIRRLLGADQVVLRIVVSHLTNTADGVLGRLQGHRILLQQNPGNRGDPLLQLRGRHSFVHE